MKFLKSEEKKGFTMMNRDKTNGIKGKKHFGIKKDVKNKVLHRWRMKNNDEDAAKNG